ncbi:MAG TPA: hypothetical protein PLQ57_11725 [Saprospiraceae bacterium]|nr:hypothetical protein [Saprospiraceae bacterium]HRG66485.1 hypothetical protein [Saprospiraceae bacterium]
MLSKIVVLIDHLEQAQTQDLKKYLLTKTYADSDIFKVFEYLAASVKKKEDQKSPEYIHEKIFPKSTKKTIANYLSLLYNWAEEWMALETLKQEEFTMDHLAQRWLNKNGLYHLADQTYNRIERGITEEGKADLHRTRIKALAMFDQLFSNNPARENLPKEKYEEMAGSFRQYMKAKLLLINTELHNWGDINNFNFTDCIQENARLIDTIESDETSHILELLLSMIRDNQVPAFMELKDILLGGRLVPGTRMFLIIGRYMQRVSMRLWSKGLIKDQKIMHDLLEFGMKSGIYFTNDRLPSAVFHNVVVQQCLISDYEETVKFIEKWMPSVVTEDTEATQALAMAQCCFYHHRYPEIHLYTGRHVFPTFNQKNLAQGLHLIAAFENRDCERHIYETALTSSQNFLKRNQLRMSKHLFDSYKNLITFIKAVDNNNERIPNPELISPLLYRKWCMELYQVSANRVSGD